MTALAVEVVERPSPPRVSRAVAPSALAAPRFGHRAELDGLRGLAILGVLVFHTGLPGTRAGFLGVDVFFGLSGFLITSLLLAERADTGSVRLAAFYFRRGLRLLPALLLLVGVTTGYAWVRHIPSLRSTAWTGLYALFYVENWAGIYAAPTTVSARFGHLWSLSVEEQFYMVWPVLLVLLVRRHPRWLVPVLAGGIGLSAATRIVLFESGSSIARVYNGSDTRADVILAGCLLAVLHSRNRNVPRTVAWAGLSAAVGWLLLTGVPKGYDTPGLYREGFVLVTLGVFSALSLIISERPRWLQWTPLVWLGTISYSLYLWHLPLAAFVPSPAWMIPAALCVACVSYYGVERPCLRFKHAWGGRFK
jgi:peptidoglycan/LPS O-acetylase OafA/YrhL